MNWLISKSNLKGVISIPSSKSLTLRAIIIASISEGRTVINNYLKSDDTSAVIDSLKKAGIEIIEESNRLVVIGNTFKPTNKVFNVLSSATALRFLIPIFLVKLKDFKITGNQDLLQRPLETFYDFFKRYNIRYSFTDNVYHIKGSLSPGLFEIDGSISSQYISGLVIALSCFAEPSQVVIRNQLVSKPYLEMTISMLNKFKANRFKFINNGVMVETGALPKAIKYTVEGDYSQASNFLVLGALGHDVKIKGLPEISLQGDIKIIDFIKEFNGNFVRENDLVFFTQSKLRGATIDLIDNPDLFLALSILAVFAEGKTKFLNIKTLAFKESNRINSIVAAFDILKISYELGENYLIIKGGHTNNSKVLDGFNDHRVIMALTIFALTTRKTHLLTNTKGISKTYPEFVNDILKLGGKITMKSIEQLRKEIIDIDKQMIKLFKERTDSIKLISVSKKELNLPIVDQEYEKTQLQTHLSFLGDESIESHYKEFYGKMLEISYSLQEGVPKMALIGQGLTHSLSPKLHHIIGRLDDFKYDFHLLNINNNYELENALNKIRTHEFKAYTVTMPYKREIIPYLDMLTNKAHITGAVNLVYLRNGFLIGDNVDYDGVYYSLETIDKNLLKYPIFILGTGATARTTAAVLRQKGLDYTFVSRNKIINDDLIKVIDYTDLETFGNYFIINTTPVGMYPKTDEMPLSVDAVKKAVFVFDVIYNPTPTKLVEHAKEGLNGLDMLVTQGIAAYNQVFERGMKISKELVEVIKKELYE